MIPGAVAAAERGLVIPGAVAAREAATEASVAGAELAMVKLVAAERVVGTAEVAAVAAAEAAQEAMR